MRDIGQPQAGAHQKLIHVSEGVAELVSRLPDGSQLCAAEHAGPNARLSWRRHSLFRVVIEYPAVVGPLVELRDRLVLGKQRRLVRSEQHTPELPTLMSIPYAAFR